MCICFPSNIVFVTFLFSFLALRSRTLCAHACVYKSYAYAAMRDLACSCQTVWCRATNHTKCGCIIHRNVFLGSSHTKPHPTRSDAQKATYERGRCAFCHSHEHSDLRRRRCSFYTVLAGDTAIQLAAAAGALHSVYVTLWQPARQRHAVTLGWYTTTYTLIMYRT